MRCALAVLLMLATSGNSFAQPNWNQFRGPNGDGRAETDRLPARWSETENVVWKTAIHGRGWSSPVVWGDRIWLTTATEDGRRMSALCLDARTGDVIHDLLIFENQKPSFCHPENSYASPTPYVTADRVFVHFGSYGTACLDSETGQRLWERRDLECNHFRGPGSSPIVDGDRLFVAFDGFDRQYVVALDKETGETVWQKERNIEYGTDNGDRKKAYSTCSMIEFDGRRQLISPSAAATISYDPKSGREWWRVYHGGMNAAVRPLFGHGLVYIAAGSGKRSLIAVRPDGSGDISESHIVWGTSRGAPKRPSQILIDDLLFMINDGGIASCLDAKTGETIWQHRFDGEYWASLFSAGGRIYAFSKSGYTPVFAASREFQLLAESQLDDGFLASPATDGKALFLRTRTHLYRVEAKQ